jgi:hypothetical protein
VIVADSAAFGVCRCRRDGTGSVVGRVDRVLIKIQLIVQSLARRSEREREVLARAVAACKGKAGVQAAAGVQDAGCSRMRSTRSPCERFSHLRRSIRHCLILLQSRVYRRKW